MASIKVYKMDGSEAGEMQLSALFESEYKEALIHQAVVTRLANERQGTKSTLTRSEVRGGGIKPWRQKGTGRARQGSIRSPQWIKGGVVFAPKSRDFSKKMNVTARRTALFSALSKKIADDEVIVLEELSLEKGKTKEMTNLFKTFNLDKSVLVVTDKADELVKRATQNIPKALMMSVDFLNTYDVVAHVKMVTTKQALFKLQEVYGNE